LRAVIQRTLKPASVTVEGKITGAIDRGLVVYLGIGKDDSEEDIPWLAKKICNLRIFSDDAGKMNKALADLGGGLLVISQFTLFASTKKGNRPSYMDSAPPTLAKELYEKFVQHLNMHYEHPVATGIFAADMNVAYTNDGPVTIIIDSKRRE